MDILAARKKAAERAREQKAAEEALAASPAQPENQEAPGDPEPVQAPVPEATEAGADEKEAPAPEPAASVPEPEEDSLSNAAGAYEESDAPGYAESPPEAPEAPDQPGGSENEPEVTDLEMLSFLLGDEQYVVMIDEVKEVLKTRDMTPVPNAPDYILGVTALRGLILPVIDLARRLGLPASVRDEKSRILVLNLADGETGVAVDRVTGVVKINPEAVRPAPDTIAHGTEFLKGIARSNDKLYILLDAEKALGS